MSLACAVLFLHMYVCSCVEVHIYTSKYVCACSRVLNSWKQDPEDLRKKGDLLSPRFGRFCLEHTSLGGPPKALAEGSP